MKRKTLLPILASLLLLTACNKSIPEEGATPSALPAGKKTVVVAVMSSDPFLEKAAREFENLHENIKIEIKPHMANPDLGNGYGAPLSKADIEKYIQTATTQAISGKSSDLISMGMLPQDKFIEKKVVANLYDFMEKDSSFDKSQYYQNVFQSSEYGNGLFALPLSFSLDAMQGNSGLLKKANIQIDDQSWTWSQFADINKKLKEQNGSDYLSFVNPSNIIADYISENYSSLVTDGTPHFDSDAFRNAMQQIKLMFSEKLIEASYTPTEKVLFSMKGLNDPKKVLLSMLDPNLQYYQKPTIEGQTKGWQFGSYTTFGLNNKSQVKQEAWEFLKFLLSEEMQASSDLMGLPINKAAFDKKLTDTEEELAQGKIEAKFKIPDSKTVKDKIQALKSLVEGDGGKNSFNDQKLLMIVFEEFGPFLLGQKSAEEASKLIQNRVMTYLNE